MFYSTETVMNTLLSFRNAVHLLTPDSKWYTWHWTSTQCLILLSITFVFVFVFLGLYNRYLHPIHTIPGPFWGSVTDLYKFVALFSQDVTQFSIELHKKYGQRDLKVCDESVLMSVKVRWYVLLRT